MDADKSGKAFDADLRGYSRIRRSFFFFGLHPKNKKLFPIVLEHKGKPYEK